MLLPPTQHCRAQSCAGDPVSKALQRSIRAPLVRLGVIPKVSDAKCAPEQPHDWPKSL